MCFKSSLVCRAIVMISSVSVGMRNDLTSLAIRAEKIMSCSQSKNTKLVSGF